ncbi:Superoxide dismutase [Mn], mitochondrial-like protein [Drosera capensis]
MTLRSIATAKTLAQSLHQRFGIASAVTVARVTQSRSIKTFSLPDLPYDYSALEPVISAEIMQLHHQKHHQAYITNYNKAVEQLEDAVQKGDAVTVVKLQSAVKFNGGGHINHSIFWKNLAPPREGGGEPPSGSLGNAIEFSFGSLEALIQKINAEGAALQGSGWVWLGLDKEFKKLVVETTANQDPLVTKGPLVPLLGIDVWEHAYYLQYKNVRPDYLKNIWKVVNWQYARHTPNQEDVKSYKAKAYSIRTNHEIKDSTLKTRRYRKAQQHVEYVHTSEVEAKLKRLVDKHVREATLEIYDYLSRPTLGRAQPLGDDDEFPQLEGHDDDGIIDEVAKEGIREQSTAEPTTVEEPVAESSIVKSLAVKPTLLNQQHKR